MPNTTALKKPFTVIGENIHATRSVRRNGRRVVTMADGTESVLFIEKSGEPRHLIVPEWYRKTQPYKQGQIKHFLIAMMKGIGCDLAERREGEAYVQMEAMRQVNAGAQYLDINVDEVHYDLDIQKRAMDWTVRAVQAVSDAPLSLDSSNSEVIAAGLDAYDSKSGRPVVNSVAPERPETLDMVKEHDAKAIVMATSGTAMPQDAGERVENTRAIVKQVLSAGVSIGDIFVDAIVFPISVDPQNGNHFFEAVESIREEYGEEINIGMGLSNVSFGMPNRKLINQTFIRLAIDSGIDSGIIDPVQTKIDAVTRMNMESVPVRFARDMLLGQDDFCLNYIQAFRDGKLS